MRYLNYLSYKLADPEITLIYRQNPICKVLPFPRCACHTWNKDLSPTEIPLVAFPAEISLYGSNSIKEAKSCAQPRVALGWGGMVELQQEQPGSGKDSVPELPGSALGAPALLCPARPCEERMIKAVVCQQILI